MVDQNNAEAKWHGIAVSVMFAGFFLFMCCLVLSGALNENDCSCCSCSTESAPAEVGTIE